ncbi:MAG: hypothetical protein OJF49_000058 [Ktedonobacterales bacterium]|nr:MAG: hypothetical protein OJF49_000058 [Ktedonobacterales bacterium]
MHCAAPMSGGSGCWPHLQWFGLLTTYFTDAPNVAPMTPRVHHNSRKCR